MLWIFFIELGMWGQIVSPMTIKTNPKIIPRDTTARYFSMGCWNKREVKPKKQTSRDLSRLFRGSCWPSQENLYPRIGWRKICRAIQDERVKSIKIEFDMISRYFHRRFSQQNHSIAPRYMMDAESGDGASEGSRASSMSSMKGAQSGTSCWVDIGTWWGKYRWAVDDYRGSYYPIYWGL